MSEITEFNEGSITISRSSLVLNVDVTAIKTVLFAILDDIEITIHVSVQHNCLLLV